MRLLPRSKPEPLSLFRPRSGGMADSLPFVENLLDIQRVFFFLEVMYIDLNVLQALRGCRYWLPLLSLLFLSGTVSAFPPAPYYTLYGMVRDQVGQTITSAPSAVIV